MARLITYSPNGILLPEEAVRRYIRLLAGTLWTWDFGSAKPQWSDSYALIHDVFKSTDGTRICAVDSSWHTVWRQQALDAFEGLRRKPGTRIIRYDHKGVRFEIGSSAVEELAEIMLPMADEFRLDSICYRGRPLQYTYHNVGYTAGEYHRRAMGRYEMELTPQMAADEAVELEFSFGGGKYRQTVSVSEHPFADLRRTPMLLHTVQKGNEPDWVVDWCKFYRRVHQVKRVVIYDNDSVNRDSLAKALMAIKDRMEIALIRWPYEYKGRFNLTQFVALNHCPLLFGDSSRYYLNLDIDEYLVNPTKAPLRRYLNRRRDDERFWYDIPQRWVPDYTEDNISGRLPRVYDYKYRAKKFTDPGKPIGIFGRFRLLTDHYAFADPQPQPEPGPIRKVWRKLKSLFKSKQRDELYYNHYQSLTTGWKDKERPVPLSQKPANLVRDEAMEAHLKKARLQ